MRWSERRPLTKVLVVSSLVLVTVGLVLGVIAVVLGQWASLGTAASLVLGGGVGCWLAVNYGGQRSGNE